MACRRLSTDVLSPLHSDISLNDISRFSFGNLSGTPDSEKDILSPVLMNSEKLFGTPFLSSSAKKESAEKFEMVTNEIKEQISQNKSYEKERLSESYKMLKQSMDELFNAKSLNTDGSYTSRNIEVENFDKLKKDYLETGVNKVTEDTHALRIHSDSLFSRSENESCTSDKRTKSKKENTSSKIEKSSKLRKSNKPQESGENKSKDCIKTKAEIKDVNSVCDGLTSKRSSKSKTSSSQTNSKSDKTETNSCTKPTEKDERKEESNVRAFQFKSQRKIPVSDNVSGSELKAVSLEKSIRTAIGLEMDNLRCFLLDQNYSMLKELFEVQDMVKKQSETTSQLFSVIDDLLEVNKNLISKCNSYKT